MQEDDPDIPFPFPFPFILGEKKPTEVMHDIIFNHNLNFRVCEFYCLIMKSTTDLEPSFLFVR